MIFNYSKVEDGDFPVTIISPSTEGPNEECYIQDLLARVAREQRSSCSILIIKNETFVLYTLPVTETTTTTIPDAASMFERFILSNQKSSISIFYKLDPNFSGRGQEKEPLYLLSILSRTHGSFFNTLSTSVTNHEICKTRTASHRRKFEKLWTNLKYREFKDFPYFRLLFWSVIIAICVVVAVIFGQYHLKPFHQHYENGIWVRYNVKASQGPKFQLQFDHHNASKWASEHPHDDGEWALRIDDQAMIPVEFMDDEEERYQRWFRKRYPEKNQIRLNQDYIKDEFLSDPAQIQVPSDHAFHMAHCVRALRRYWQAKETGKHVCPRDIDYRHMQHCLDSLDEWAFPDGERGSVKVPVDTGTWRLIWETKVCF